MHKMTCRCGWRGIFTALLRAPDPFNPGDELTACPECRQQDDMSTACETDGCWKDATCGGTFADGVYRWTCGPHADWMRIAKAATPL
jgi:hypothetical protein